MKCIFVHIYISIQDKTTIENILDFEKTFYFIPDSRKYKNYVKLCCLSRNICKKMYSWSQLTAVPYSRPQVLSRPGHNFIFGVAEEKKSWTINNFAVIPAGPSLKQERLPSRWLIFSSFSSQSPFDDSTRACNEPTSAFTIKKLLRHYAKRGQNMVGRCKIGTHSVLIVSEMW